MNMNILLIIISFLILYLVFTHLNKRKEEEKFSNLFSVMPISSKKYELQIFPNLLTKDECEQIIELAKKNNMSPSQVVTDKSTSDYNVDSRNSVQIWFNPKTHPVLQKLSKISEDLTGYPFENQEYVQIVKYDVGGKFDEHYDSCLQSEKICQQMNRGAGERRTTLLVYLNEEMEGGETEFVILNQKIKPEIGKAILFYSSDDQDKILKDSKHRGCPVLKGEKWIATIWSHALPFPN